jgi:hypothetical protein
VLERAQQQVRQVVERLPDELLEVGGVARVERHELDLVGLGGQVLAGEPLRAPHELLELVLVGRLGVVGQPARDRRDDHAQDPDRRDGDRDGLHAPDQERVGDALEQRDDEDRDAQAERGGDGDAASGGPVREQHV